MSTYRLNEAHKGVEILFDSKPSEKVREALKNQGFRWNKTGGYWYAKQSAERIELAKSLTSCKPSGGKPSELRAASLQSCELNEAELARYTTSASAGYMGATELTGSMYANGARLYGAELSKAIREALKRCGIGGASVRCHTFAGGQEIAVTLKVSDAELVSEADYISATADDIRGYWYTAPNGEQIHRDAMPWGDGAKEIIDHTHKLQYRYAVKDMRDSYGLSVRGDEEIFTKEFVKKIKAVKQILNAFNHDDSNGMVDYFDTHFYDEIRVKAA